MKGFDRDHQSGLADWVGYIRSFIPLVALRHGVIERNSLERLMCVAVLSLAIAGIFSIL
jgi:hypothetical protein